MHDGGDRVEMRINGKLACNSTATYSPSGHGQSISGFLDCVEPVKVTKGDRIQIAAFFDHEKHQP